MLASLEILDMAKMYTVTLTMATNDVSRVQRGIEEGDEAAREDELHS